MNNPIVITGATGAIGGAAARELAKIGKNDLIIVGRNETALLKLKSELAAINPDIAVEVVVADLSSVKSVRNAIGSIKSKTNSLSGILNIAAVYRKSRIVTDEGFELMFATNHLGPFQLTNGLLDQLMSGSKVITVTAPSATKLDFDDLQGEKKFSALNRFGASKMGNLLFSFALARKLQGKEIVVMAFHPGLVKSDLTIEMPAMLRNLINLFSSSPVEPGKALAKLLTEAPTKNLSSKFLNRKKKELKKPGYSGNEEIQEKLWVMSLEMIRQF